MNNSNNCGIFQREKVIDTFRLIVRPGVVTELRLLNSTSISDSRPCTRSGYFNDPAKMADALHEITSATGVYFIPNEVDPSLLTRSVNRLQKAKKGETTSDSNIVQRVWLLIDCDFRRPSGIGSDKSQHRAALRKAVEISKHLDGLGWPKGILADSGNGGHLLYRIDLPPGDDGLVRKCLEALAQRFDDEVVVDKSVHNAARIWKLYGTRACKGDDTDERPHRMSRVIQKPKIFDVVSREQLEKLAADYRPAIVANTGKWPDVERLIKKHDLKVSNPKEWNGGRVWTFRESPMCDHHNDGPHIEQHEDGRITAGCHHNSCTWNIYDLLAKFEPFHGPVGITIPFSEIEPREVSWLWQDRIPLGAITLLSGYPGVAKSFVSCDCAARVSQGLDWPDGSKCNSGSVIFITCEDDPNHVIRPRLDAHNADVQKIHLLSGVQIEKSNGEVSERFFTLRDVEALESALKKHTDCSLVIIDPVGSFIGGIDTNKDNKVREVLAPVAKLASDYHVAVLAVVHRGKSPRSRADDSVLGSIGFVGISRSVLHLFRDPENDKRRLLLPGKNNYSVAASGLGFSIMGNTPSINWERDPVDTTADELFRIESISGNPKKLDQAVEWLSEFLSNGPKSANDVKASAKKYGISERTLQRAIRELRVDSQPSAFQGQWLLTLPAESSVSQRLSDSANSENVADSGTSGEVWEQLEKEAS